MCGKSQLISCLFLFIAAIHENSWAQITYGIRHLRLFSLPTDYFRSKSSGDWGTVGTWESSADNISWIAATTLPTSSANTITIQNAHTVKVTTTISLDQLTLLGILDVITGAVLNINDGPGSDIDIGNGGVLSSQSTASYSTVFVFGGSANFHISTGAKITVGNGVAPVGTNYESFATSNLNAWDNGSIFEWNALTTFKMSGLTFFPNAAIAIPVFRVTANAGIPTSGATGTTINGIFEVDTALTLAGGSTKIFRDGIRGTATLTENGTAGNSFHITSPAAILDGSLQLILTSPLNLANGIVIPLGADIKISGANISKSAGNFLVDGTIDITDVAISNTSGNVTLNGTLKTARTTGLYNPGSIASGVININPGSTVEYNALTNQSVSTTINYFNVTFSGTGTKLPSGNLNASGTVKITSAAIVDASNNNLGGTGTGFTMDGGGFILGTTGTQPAMTGPYNITGGVLQFTNSSITGQTIRSPKTYFNIEVTGKNVGNSLGNISLAAGGSFTVKSGGIFSINADQLTGAAGNQSVVIENGATFRCGNADGFSGGNGMLGKITSIKSDIESIILNPGDTIEYSRTTSGGDQVVTTAHGYENIILSGAGIKNVSSGVFNLGATGSMEIRSTTRFDADGSTTLNFNNRPVVIRSDTFGTGSIGDLTGVTLLNNNNFTVERYIPPHRAWRLLTAPVVSTQTIKQAWQENQTNPDLNYANNSDLVKGYGTHITGNSQSTAFGYDPGPQNNSSLKIYNSALNSIARWSALPAGTGPNNTMINAYAGYMLFVRGNRSLKLSDGTAAPPSATILRTNGQLISGDQVINVPAIGFTLVRNPFPSSLDMRNINLTGGVEPFYYLWDPHLGSVGGFQVFSMVGGNFIPTPDGGSYTGAYNFIQEGLAFFVHSTAAGTVSIKESSKSSSNTNNPFRTVKPGMQLRTNLYSPDGSILLDGVLCIFRESGNDKVDGGDAEKLNNFSETIGIAGRNKILAVEERRQLNFGDSIKYTFSQMANKDYVIEFIAQGLDRPHMAGYLIDSVTGRNTLIDLNGTTRIKFSVSGTTADLAGRFTLVFMNEKNQERPIVKGRNLEIQRSPLRGLISLQ